MALSQLQSLDFGLDPETVDAPPPMLLLPGL